MPHLFLSRPRVHQLFQVRSHLLTHHKWQSINAFCYGAGGVFFCAGSIFSFPYLEDYVDIGTSCFFTGSIVYSVVTLHDLLEVLANAIMYKRKSTLKTTLEFTTAFLYLFGTALFIVRGIFAFGDKFVEAAYCFIIGSVAFLVGASINMLQIVRASSLTQLQLLNMTALSFIIGSVLYVVASIPYLWEQHDDNRLFNFLASQYLLGSFLFLFGGICNYGRSKMVLEMVLDKIDRHVLEEVEASNTNEGEESEKTPLLTRDVEREKVRWKRYGQNHVGQ